MLTRLQLTVAKCIPNGRLPASTQGLEPIRVQSAYLTAVLQDRINPEMIYCLLSSLRAIWACCGSHS